MTKVIGIRFRKAGKVYYFSPGENEIKTGDHVIVETARGVEYGYVVLGTHEVDDKKVIQPLKCVIRMATHRSQVPPVWPGTYLPPVPVIYCAASSRSA